MTPTSPSAPPAGAGVKGERGLFRAWLLFGIGVASGALLGVIVGVAIALSAIVTGGGGDPEVVFGSVLMAAYFGGVNGVLVGVIGGVGGFAAVLLFDRGLRRDALQRALIAGAGSATAGGIGWLVVDPLSMSGLMQDTSGRVLSTAAVGWAAGVLAAASVWVVEGRQQRAASATLIE